MRRAVFFDRDGVLTVDKGVERNIREMELYPAAADTIAFMRSSGFLIFVVTNQPVVARGLVSEDDLRDHFRLFERELLLRNPDAVVDMIYYCPHHPSANLERYRVLCECRKPKPGMLLRAAREFGVDLASSYMVGDRITDIVAGAAAGCRTVQCLTGKHDDGLIETDMVFDRNTEPDYRIVNLGELKEIVR
ncbi:MAG: HAD family hydrolase [Spirochaetes bacterium]|nr:HAD family hydrolase [Spirochaetota bacterium]